jgi:predicted NAD-dependent protein-ADP-ribosyltransferase YbiA (DUF1768 family)
VSPWERRERGGLYYYRSRRVNGRVEKEYIGNGSLAKLAAEADALERHQREEEAKAWQAEREQLEALEELTEELCEAAELLTRAALLTAGYRQHHRGEWRKQRERDDANP